MSRKWVSLCLLIVCISSFALPNDREQVVHITADSADLNQQSHQGIYIGHVQFLQGTTNLHAGEAITTGNEKNKLILATAKGDKKNQAHYWTLTAVNKPELHAYADIIHYHPEKHLIELIGNAKVIQGNNSFSAPTICYDTVKQHVISKNDGKQQTTIIFYPEKKKL